MNKFKELSQKNKRIIIFIIFAVIAFVVYADSLNSSFQFDDYNTIVDNPRIAMTELSYGSLKGAALANPFSVRPLAHLSFALNHYFNGFNPTGYHVVNTIIHILNAFLIYLIIMRVFGTEGEDDDAKEKLTASAFFTALIWLVTPLNSQAVIYVVQRMTLMMTLFFLSSFYAYLLWKKSGRAVFVILSFALFVLAMLSKESAVVLPVIILASEIIFVKKGNLKDISQAEIATILVLLMTCLVPVIIYRGEIFMQFTEVGKYGFSAGEKILTQFRVTILYLSLLFFPTPDRLSVTHDIATSTSLTSPITTLFSIIFIVTAAILAAHRRKKSPYFSFAVLFFLITLSVEAIIPLEMMYEHRMYLPGIFIIGMVVDYVVNKFYVMKRARVIAVFTSIVILLATLTTIRSNAWESEFTLWNDVYSKYPNDVRARFNLGTWNAKKGNKNEAVAHLKYVVEKHEQKPEGETAVITLYNLADVYNNLGSVQYEQEKFDEAEKNLMKAIEIKEDFAKAFNNLGNVYYAKKDNEKAIAMYKSALEHDPDFAEATSNLGLQYLEAEETQNAKQYLERAIELNDRNVNAYKGLIIINYAEKEYQKVVDYAMKIVEMNSNDAFAKKSIRESLKFIQKKAHNPVE